MTYYSAPSGAGVFDVGTQAWVNASARPTKSRRVGITTNVLTAFGRGPAGPTHPSRGANQTRRSLWPRALRLSAATPSVHPAQIARSGVVRHASAAVLALLPCEECQSRGA